MKVRYLIYNGGKLIGEVFVLDPRYIEIRKPLGMLRAVRMVNGR